MRNAEAGAKAATKRAYATDSSLAGFNLMARKGSGRRTSRA